MGALSSKNHFPVPGRTMLITGGSLGMGKALAQLLSSKGANVIIVARKPQALADALSDVTRSAANESFQRFHSIVADLSVPSEAQRVVSEATEWNNGKPLDAVICCAGSAVPKFFVDTPVEQIEQMMSSNYYTAAYTAHAVLRSWLKPSTKAETKANPPATKKQLPPPRHLIFTASAAAFLSLTGWTTYTPSKMAIRALAEGLSQEVLLYPVSPSQPAVEVHTVYPGGILTAALEEENKIKPGILKKLEEDDTPLTPEQVALKTLKGLEKGKESITMDILGWAMWCGSIMGGQRNILDVFGSWIVVLVLWFVRWDHRGKIKSWGAKNNISGYKV
ncbi:hypothetical protein MMC25_007795 [Agyrium rufum]|nr:hypothetical protein [Agyrium rufum]